MKHLTIIRIASNRFASWSSRDRYVHKFGDHHYNLDIDSKRLYEINGEMWSITNFVHEPQRHIRTDLTKQELDEKVKYYLDQNDFFMGEPDFLRTYYDLKYTINKVTSEKQRLDAEYVNWKRYPSTHTPKELVGGFDLEIIFQEKLISYMEMGRVYGYIGHDCRKIWVDAMLQEIVLPYLKFEDFACWLTSTDGRHFGDSIEDYVKEDDKETVKKKIQKQLPYIHNNAITYNHPDHGGTLASSLKLFEILNDMGMMMKVEDEEDDEKQNS